MKITIQNDFHHTEATVYLECLPAELTERHVRRIRRTLCGIEGCTCGGALSERGPQDVYIDYTGPGAYDVGLWAIEGGA